MEENNEMTTQNINESQNEETQVTDMVTEEYPNAETVQTQTPVMEENGEEVTAQTPAMEENGEEVTAQAPVMEESGETGQAQTQVTEQTGESAQAQAPVMNNNPGNYQGWAPVGAVPYIYGGYYGPNAPQGSMPPYMVPPQEKKPVKEKRRIRKEHPVLFKIVDAVVFGIVAALAFIGCNYLYGYFFPKQAEKYDVVQIGTDSRKVNAEAVKTAETVENVITSTPDVSSIVEKVAPAIVQIDCIFNTTSYFGSYQTPGAGSGIVIKKTDKELLVATNNHVVEGAASIKITFTDGTTANAVIKGTDAVADLAVVSVDLSEFEEGYADTITVAKLGNSDDVKVGQLAIAIGNAMGYGQSTTVGYISATGREVTVEGTKMTGLIQTDAAINPGNSGGALINASGEVIGINSVKFASTQVEGMGFAIPISRAQKILDELGNRESLTHEEKGYLGVHVQTVTAGIAQAYNWPQGVYVAEVDEGLAAEKYGIEIGDIIVRINSVTVSTTTDLKTAISSNRAGSTVTVTVMRIVDDKFEEVDIEVVLGHEPDEEEAPAEEPSKEEKPDEEKTEEVDPDAPKASPKDGLPGELPQGDQYSQGELPDYFDPFKDFEDMFPFGNW